MGSGPKPRRIKGLPSTRTEDASDVSALPPEDLPADQRDFWHRYAALAIEKRTLTSHTVAAFRQLCEMDAERRARRAQIDHDGRTYIKAWVDASGQEHEELKPHPLIAKHDGLWKDVMAGLGRFGLAPFGKAEAVLPKAKASNPWAQMGGQK